MAKATKNTAGSAAPQRTRSPANNQLTAAPRASAAAASKGLRRANNTGAVMSNTAMHPTTPPWGLCSLTRPAARATPYALNPSANATSPAPTSRMPKTGYFSNLVTRRRVTG